MSQLGESGPAEHLGVAGSGAVACGLAACAALAGGRVTVWARSAESARRARDAVQRDCERGGQSGSAERIEVTTEPAALAGSALLVEAVAEDEFIKREVLGGLAAAAADSVLLASTTSSLSIAGLAAASGVPACMRLGAAYPMGPLELLDFVGLDVADAIGEAIHADTDDPAHRPPGRIKQLVGEGRLGRKSGAGFYTHD